jgi:hypothetical protein
MSLTAAPSLHRFIPRRALETTAFGYEVIAANHCVDECVRTVHWIDCWCPDAAQFILVEASDDLGANTCHTLIRAICESHLRAKIRLVCRAANLADEQLVASLHRQGIGFLLVRSDQSSLKSWTDKGILGIRVDAGSAGTPDPRQHGFDARQLVKKAHDLGLRSIASQVSSSEGVRTLLSLGFDYVSQRDSGFVAPDPSFAWQGRVG